MARISISCADMGTSWCDYVAYGETMEELQDQVVVHGRKVHDLEEEQLRNPEATAMMHALAKDA